MRKPENDINKCAKFFSLKTDNAKIAFYRIKRMWSGFIANESEKKTHSIFPVDKEHFFSSFSKSTRKCKLAIEDVRVSKYVTEWKRRQTEEIKAENSMIELEKE